MSLHLALEREALPPPLLALAGEFNVFTALDTKALLLEVIAAAVQSEDPALRVDLSQVTDIDSAGLQLMVMARREARRHDKHLYFAPCSEPVMALVTLCDLVDPLDVRASANLAR